MSLDKNSRRSFGAQRLLAIPSFVAPRLRPGKKSKDKPNLGVVHCRMQIKPKNRNVIDVANSPKSPLCRTGSPRIKKAKGDCSSALLPIKQFKSLRGISLGWRKNECANRESTKERIPEVLSLKRLPDKAPLQVREGHTGGRALELPVRDFSQGV